MIILLCFLGERGAQKFVTRVTGGGGATIFVTREMKIKLAINSCKRLKHHITA